MPRWDIQVIHNRQKAIANGDETYQGHPCKHGHTGTRMTKYHGKCFDCHQGKSPYYADPDVPYYSTPGVKEHRRKIYLENPARFMYRRTLSRAKKLGLACDLVEEDIIIPDFCPITLERMVSCTPYAPSIDRVDSAGGYTKDNIQVISKKANAAKSDLTIEEVERMLNYMRRHELLK